MELLEDATRDELIETARCYIDSGLPLILGVDVFTVEPSGKLSRKAGHAVSILGYKISSGVREPGASVDGDALYIHDDRLGPFARASFVDLSTEKLSGSSRSWGLSVQEKNDSGGWNDPHEVFIPNVLIAPTHRKVRLAPSYAINTCKTIVKAYEKEVTWLQQNCGGAYPSAHLGRLTYDIRLQEVSVVKRSVLASTMCRSFFDGTDEYFATDADLAELQRQKTRFLTSSLARFQWVANFSYLGQPVFTVLTDATDIPQGHAISAVIVHNKYGGDATLEIMRIAFESPKALHSVEDEDENGQTFFMSFLRRLMPGQYGLGDHLDKTYGEPRAPRKIKESEFSDGRILKNDTLERFYEPVDKRLEELFPSLKSANTGDCMIWAIDQEGALLIGQETNNMGHPCLTGFKPARIAGELKRGDLGWLINSKSGRYSVDYANAPELLQNALLRFKSIFHASKDELTIEAWQR